MLRDSDEAVRIVHFVPVVEPKSLFIDVPEQVERFHANVGTVQSALQQTPKVLAAVSVKRSLPRTLLHGRSPNGRRYRKARRRTSERRCRR